jgi:hypothetical protein
MWWLTSFWPKSCFGRVWRGTCDEDSTMLVTPAMSHIWISRRGFERIFW